MENIVVNISLIGKYNYHYKKEQYKERRKYIMENTIITTNNYLLIKRLEPKGVTEGGIVLADVSLKKSRWGYVIDIGEGLPDINGKECPPDVEIGDLVFFMQHAPELVDYTPEGLGEFFLVSEGDVMIKVRSVGEDVSIIPMGNYCHIEELEETVQTHSAGGIILPEKAVERPTRGRVLATGMGQRTLTNFYSPRVKAGDIVTYRKYSTLDVNFDDLGIKSGKTKIVGFGDITAVFTEGWKEAIQERLAKMNV